MTTTIIHHVRRPTYRRRVQALEAEIEQMSICPLWQCHTRAGVDRRIRALDTSSYAVIYADIDDMKALNTAHGRLGVNPRVAAALQQIRRDDVIDGRWQEGDELVVIAPAHDIAGLGRRLTIAFRQQQIGITWASAPITSDVYAAVDCAGVVVERAKAERLAFWCSTVGRAFRSSDYTITAKGEAAWTCCLYCDARRNTHDDPGYDPAMPQVHVAILEDGQWIASK